VEFFSPTDLEMIGVVVVKAGVVLNRMDHSIACGMCTGDQAPPIFPMSCLFNLKSIDKIAHGKLMPGLQGQPRLRGQRNKSSSISTVQA
jgi:hypothetical protein